MPIGTPKGTVISLVSAFFDDADEPLAVRTPLFGDEEPSVEIVGILMAERVDIYFFDEHSKEWMSHSCRLEDPGSYLASGEPVHLLEYSPSNSAQLLESLRDWFSHRTPEDVRAGCIWPRSSTWRPARSRDRPCAITCAPSCRWRR